MKDAKWWTPDMIFAVGLGAVMAGFFGVSFFTPAGSRTGSELVPAAMLEMLRDEGQSCQTVTDEDVTNRTPRNRC
jgi:hypothetical protein